MRVTRARRLLILLCAAATLAAACKTPVVPEVAAPATPTPVPVPTATPAPVEPDAPTPTPAPFEAEPGLTAEEIRIGVIYDVGGGPIADELAESAPQAIEAWADDINRRESGLAGRTIVVERIPTSPLLADHAEAIDLACGRDLFALVGSTALFDNEGIDQLESPDCGLPDFPSVVSSFERLRSSVTTVSNPITANTWSAGWARYYVEAAPEATANAATMLLDLPVTVVTGSRMIEAATAQGFEFVYGPQVAFDTDYVEEVGELADIEPGLLAWPSDAGRLLSVLRELDAQAVDIPIVNCGQSCYSRSWVETAGVLGDGVSVWLATHPLEEGDLSTELNRYIFFLGGAHPGAAPTATGVNAWASALLFEEAVRIAVGEDTPDYDPASLTRAGVLGAARNITSWDARGLHGVANPAERIPSSCFVLMTLTDGVWERTFPERRGEFDCAPENLVNLTITAGSGEGSDGPAPTPDEAPADEVEDGS